MELLSLTPGTICVLVGPPGCGKSTFAARYPASWRVCLDLYRLAATDDEADQTATPVAAEIQNLLLDARLARGRTTLVDSCNVHAHVREGLLARARYWQRPIVAVLFDVPLAIAEAQNSNRDRVVPSSVVRDLHEMLPTADQLRREGFHQVHQISRAQPADPGPLQTEREHLAEQARELAAQTTAFAAGLIRSQPVTDHAQRIAALARDLARTAARVEAVRA
ncbi:AAA family ATPase [Streptomyces werraensis]|uniref:AAA family ATPase n=1 Tax=Streptomyces werraensis TaxID=68284 RepID=A0ABV3JP20_9ACTN